MNGGAETAAWLRVLLARGFAVFVGTNGCAETETDDGGGAAAAAAAAPPGMNGAAVGSTMMRTYDSTRILLFSSSLVTDACCDAESWREVPKMSAAKGREGRKGAEK